MFDIILFKELLHYLMDDHIYGFKKETDNNKVAPIVTDWIDEYYKNNTEDQIGAFRGKFNKQAKYKSSEGIYRHLIYLWCLDGLNTYKEDGSLLSANLSVSEFLSKLLNEFSENNRFKKEELKIFLNGKKLPLPHEFFQRETEEAILAIKNKKAYNPRNIIYKLAFEKLKEINDCETGWRRLIEATDGLDFNNDKTSILALDEFNEEISVEVKSFQNACSKMKSSLKNNK